MLPIFDRKGNLTGFVQERQLIAVKLGSVVMLTNDCKGFQLGQILRVVGVPNEDSAQTLTVEVL